MSSSLGSFNYGNIYVNASDSIVNITFKGNNITTSGSTSSYCFNFNIQSSNSTLFFENDNIRVIGE